MRRAAFVCPVFTLCLLACQITPAISSVSSSAASEQRFRSYDYAVRYVRSHYSGERFDTSRSSWITSAEYYPAHGRGYLILGMRGNPYIFVGVSQSLWKGFKVAPSLGRYYHQHIRGRYRLNLDQR